MKPHLVKTRPILNRNARQQDVRYVLLVTLHEQKPFNIPHEGRRVHGPDFMFPLGQCDSEACSICKAPIGTWKGMRPLIERRCNFRKTITMSGPIYLLVINGELVAPESNKSDFYRQCHEAETIVECLLEDGQLKFEVTKNRNAPLATHYVHLKAVMHSKDAPYRK